MSKVISCALLVECPAGWLLASATCSKPERWDFPKGRMDEGETPLQTALRETLEETGLDLSAHRQAIEDLGLASYIPKKDLHLFRLILDEALDLSQCTCSTFVEIPGGKRFPETNAYAWIHPHDIPSKVGKGLCKYLQVRGLLPEKPVSSMGMKP